MNKYKDCKNFYDGPAIFGCKPRAWIWIVNNQAHGWCLGDDAAKERMQASKQSRVIVVSRLFILSTIFGMSIATNKISI
jgi:hypothetical protein